MNEVSNDHRDPNAHTKQVLQLVDHAQPSLETSPYIMGLTVSAIAPQRRQTLLASCFLGRFQFDTWDVSIALYLVTRNKIVHQNGVTTVTIQT